MPHRLTEQTDALAIECRDVVWLPTGYEPTWLCDCRCKPDIRWRLCALAARACRDQAAEHVGSLAMKRFLMAMACSSSLLGAQIIVAQPERPAVLAKRQLSECMTKRMSADRNLSYNDAMHACKQRLQPPKDVASINAIATGTKAP